MGMRVIIFKNDNENIRVKVHEISLDAAHEEVVLLDEVLILVHEQIHILITFKRDLTSYLHGFEHFADDQIS
jgi:hypothetical protein